MHLGALSHLAKNPGATLESIAALFDVDRPVASGLVARLERSGLVRREQNPKNRRNPFLFLTEEGESTRLSSLPAFRRAMDELSQGFTGPEIDVVLRFLNAIVWNFSDERRPAGGETALVAGRGSLTWKLGRVTDYIDANLGKKLPLSALAKVFGASVSHFNTVFKQSTAMSVHRYVMQRRVERARELLDGGVPIATVALEAGFSDPSHLARWTRRLLGVTPRHVSTGERLLGRKPDAR
jgi:AraC-like DNA-binding protein/DNA-binding MarR family transcriptional regulator